MGWGDEFTLGIRASGVTEPLERNRFRQAAQQKELRPVSLNSEGRGSRPQPGFSGCRGTRVSEGSLRVLP
eukprot:719867-Rhodomonas_salina.1